MIELPSDLPEGDTDSISVVADWIELCMIAGGETLSFQHVAAVCRDAGLCSHIELVDANDSNRLEEDSNRFLEDTWVELKGREKLLGDQYPLAVRDRTLELVGDMESCPSFVLLLLAATARHYDCGETKELPRLFEHVVVASATGLLGGKAARFGWPPDEDTPSSVHDRIKHIARKLELEPQNLGEKVGAHDKDVGLDVAAHHAVGGSAVGSVVFLIQCATGRNWTGKAGVSVERWKDLIQWNSVPVPAFAVPWWWARDEEYLRHFRRMGHAVVLDRARLLKGRPDGHLDVDRKADVEKWARRRLTALPKL